MVIYKITNKITGKSYIGATRRERLGKRMVEHQYRAQNRREHGHMSLIAMAIRENGWENFEVSEVATASSHEELMSLERSAIALHKTLSPLGYNMDPGGGGLVPSSKKIVAWNKGIPHTAEARAKMSETRKGGRNARARKIEYHGVEYPCVEDACKALGLSRGQMNRRLKLGFAKFLTPAIVGNYGQQNKGKKASDEARAKMSAARKGKPMWQTRAIAFNGVRYDSIQLACEATGLSRMQMKTRLKNGVAVYVTAPKLGAVH